MKKFNRLVFAAFGLAILLYLTACESETVAPKKTNLETASQPNDLIIAAPLYRLSKRGMDVVEYDASNRLKKVIMHSSFYRTYDWHTTNNQHYLTTKAYFNNTLIQKIDYKLSNNLCISSTAQSYSNGSPSSSKTYVYNYNGKGKLAWLYNPNTPQERTFFTYNALGDLIKMEEYNYKGIKVKTREFNYTNQETPTKQPDKYHFNVEWEELDFYPKIFGRFTEHLPMLMREVNASNAVTNTTMYAYRYQFKSGGYVAKRQTYLYYSGEPVGDLSYGYQMVVLGKQ